MVIKAGIFTQLQDLGRYGQALQGLSQGGVCDELAANWANYLLDNPSNCSLLEICFGQAEFEAQSDLQLALTGAPMHAQIIACSGQLKEQNNNCSFILKKGQHLKLSFASSGMRSYLAVKNGFDVKPMLGSVSSVRRNLIGGLSGDGSILQDNDFLPVFSVSSKQSIDFIKRQMPTLYIADYNLPVSLAVIESYQCDGFSVHEKQRFYNNPYQIDTQSDRMGLRLNGRAIRSQLSAIISEGIALGSIQVPADGLPIILLQDRQTLGGYPKIGCVSRCDLSLLAQQSVGKKIVFKRGNLQAEQLRYIQRLRFFNQ